MGIASEEPKLRGQIAVAQDKEPFIVMLHNLSDEKYLWAKVIDSTMIKSNSIATVRYTPDFSKILVVFFTDVGPNFVYFDPSNGDTKGTGQSLVCCPRITGKDSVSMDSTGATIFSIAHLEARSAVVLQRMTYDEGTQKFHLKAANAWKTDET